MSQLPERLDQLADELDSVAVDLPDDYLRALLKRGASLITSELERASIRATADREFLRNALTHGVTAEQLPHALAVVNRVTGHG